jgi:LPS sulfotransferase NodH
VHLRRENILRTHLSRARAERSNRWINLSGEQKDAEPIQMSYAECLADFTRTRQWEREAEAFFDRQPRLDLTYEALAADYPAAARRIQDFLGLPAQPVTPRTHKQDRQPLSAAIANYTELKRCFAGSEWAGFFEE